MNYPSVTVLIPCRNEAKYITDCLDSILNQDYPSEKLTIMVIDGHSEDKTRELIRKFKKVTLLENPHKHVSSSLNMGIKKVVSEYIVRMDVHCIYPSNYISLLINESIKLKADNIGLPIKTLSANQTNKSKAIAQVMSSIFGVGNSLFRTGIKETCKVDTVPFGCFKKTIFEKLGFFDEDLIRNQDDEFNSRIIKAGGTIYLLPEPYIKYYARDNFLMLFKMFYQYGLFKPMVNDKIGKTTSYRQLIPPLFVTYLFFLTLIFFDTPYNRFLFIPLFLYLLLNTFFSFRLAVKNQIPLPFLVYAFFVIHFSYGLGYLKGVFNNTFNLKFNIGSSR